MYKRSTIIGRQSLRYFSRMRKISCWGYVQHTCRYTCTTHSEVNISASLQMQCSHSEANSDPSCASLLVTHILCMEWGETEMVKILKFGLPRFVGGEQSFANAFKWKKSIHCNARLSAAIMNGERSCLPVQCPWNCALQPLLNRVATQYTVDIIVNIPCRIIHCTQAKIVPLSAPRGDKRSDLTKRCRFGSRTKRKPACTEPCSLSPLSLPLSLSLSLSLSFSLSLSLCLSVSLS